LASGNNDVLAAILDAYVAVRLAHGQVACVEPTAAQGLLGSLRVLQIPLHGDIAAEHDLAHGLAIGRDGFHGLRVQNLYAPLQVITRPLTGIALRTVLDIQLAPGGMLRT